MATKSFKFPTSDADWNSKSKAELVAIQKKAEVYGLGSTANKAKEIRDTKFPSAMPLLGNLSHPDDLKYPDIANDIKESFKFFFELRAKLKKHLPQRTMNMIRNNGYIYAMARANLANDDSNFQLLKNAGKDTYTHTAEWLLAVKYKDFFENQFRAEKFGNSEYKKAYKQAIDKLQVNHLAPNN